MSWEEFPENAKAENALSLVSEYIDILKCGILPLEKEKDICNIVIRAANDMVREMKNNYQFFYALAILYMTENPNFQKFEDYNSMIFNSSIPNYKDNYRNIMINILEEESSELYQTALIDVKKELRKASLQVDFSKIPSSIPIFLRPRAIAEDWARFRKELKKYTVSEEMLKEFADD